MDRSIIPPPTVSMLLPQAEHIHKKVSQENNDDLARLDRALQRHMQSLLDAQNNALFGGGNADSSEVGGDHNSRSSERSQMKAGVTKVVPVRQRSRAPTGLREIRHDISDTMSKLSVVKKQQAHRSGENLDLINAHNARLEGWQKRENQLKDTIDSMRHDRRDEEARKLLDEEDSLQEQINAMERKLAELRAQQQTLRRRRSNLQNATQANASSYEASLSLLMKEKDEFLRRPSPDLKSILESVDAPVLRTHANRRTLAQISAALKDAEQAEITRRDEAQVEQKALHAGNQIWLDSVRRVDHMEAAVKSGLAKLTSAKPDHNDASRGAEQLLATLNDEFQGLQKLYDMAEDRGWSLLVCCIGAELEAMKRGCDIIERTLLLVHKGSPHEPGIEDAEDAHDNTSAISRSDDGGTRDHETDPQDLLFSRKDTDSD